MKIIILGAGRVGCSMAEHLATESNDITMVDMDLSRLRALQNRLDIGTVVGYGAHPRILEQAGIEDADMLVAVTDSDETNMIACQVAHSLYQTPQKIARVRSSEYMFHNKLFCDEVIPIDVLISPEILVTNHVVQLIDHPGALQVLDFAEGKAQLLALKVRADSHVLNCCLRDLSKHLGGTEVWVAAIYRHGQPMMPDGSSRIKAGDEVFLVAKRSIVDRLLINFMPDVRRNKRIIIAGGGNIGRQMAEALEERYQVKVIEHNRDACKALAADLHNSIVLLGDGADRDLLLEENIEDTDVFCAVTNDDETNIMASILAKRLGATKVVTLINRAAYVDLIEGGDIDIAFSPQQITISDLLAHVRRGDVARVHSLRRGAAEAMEAIVHGDRNTSKVAGRCIGDIKWPAGTSVGAVVRGDEVLMPHHDTVLDEEDHVIVFVFDKRRIKDIERLFQVDVTFI